MELHPQGRERDGQSGVSVYLIILIWLTYDGSDNINQPQSNSVFMGNFGVSNVYVFDLFVLFNLIVPPQPSDSPKG